MQFFFSSSCLNLVTILQDLMGCCNLLNEIFCNSYFACSSEIVEKFKVDKYIFCKFEIVVCFAPLLHGVQKNTFLNFDSIKDSLKSKTWNSWKRMHCNEEARRIRGNGTTRSRMQEWRGKKNGSVPRLRSLPDSYRQAGWECERWETASVSDLGSLIQCIIEISDYRDQCQLVSEGLAISHLISGNTDCIITWRIIRTSPIQLPKRCP